MPLYEYECVKHGSFDLMRPMSRAGESAACPVCERPAARVITAPALFTMSPTRRDAIALNERSRHEPHVCKTGCGHRHTAPSSAKAAKERRDGGTTLQAYTGPRPWVVEHR